VAAKQPSKRPSDHDKGQTLYERSCWMCHGETAAGDGPAAASLPGGVPDLRGQLPEERWDDLVSGIMAGHGACPAFAAELDRRDARRILLYLKKLEEEPPEPEEDPAAAETDAPPPEVPAEKSP